MRRKKADEQGVPGAATGRITPAEVQQVEFRLGFRGYNERDVDAFLDRITGDLSAYLEENERLRTGVGLPIASAMPATDVDAARREAEEIVARAREQADAIVRQAEVRAAAGAGGPGDAGDTRAAVAPFLNREREFLQGLGSLVQTHAEEIRQMVLALRARTESTPAGEAPRAEPTAAAPAAPAAEHRPGSLQGASAAEIRERLGEPGDDRTTERDRQDEREPVVIESSTEPAYSSEGAPAGEARERSLRELFWGED
jgi:DivIVA domain-containing protein